MPEQRTAPGSRPKPATREDIEHIVGEIDEARLVDILALTPTVAEVEQAVMWAAGNGDVLAKSGHALTPTISGIVEILTAGEEEEPPPVR